MPGSKMVKNAIFICAGDMETFSAYCIDNLLPDFDLIINFFGADEQKYSKLATHAKYIQKLSGTKFLTIKNIFDNNPKIFNAYDYIVCWDDDASIIEGDLSKTIDVAKFFDVNIISPSHDVNGKLSFSIMKQYPGNHVIRYTNFIEMNFPIFKSNILSKYLSIYDKSLYGFGNDWWYLNTIEANNENTYQCAIDDSLVVHNPYNTSDKDNISSFISIDNRKQQWHSLKVKCKLKQWKPKTLSYVHKNRNQIILTPTKLLP